jgi:hypothetical protein
MHRIAGLVLEPYLDPRRFGEVIENLRGFALGKLSAVEICQILDRRRAARRFNDERNSLVAKLNPSKSCGIYSLTKPAYLASRRTAAMISDPLLSPSIVTSIPAT